MKKLLFIIPLLLINLSIVKADTELYLPEYYNTFSFYSDISSNYSSIISDLISYYNVNWSNTYSDYIIRTDVVPNSTSDGYIEIIPANNSDFIGWYDTNGHKYLCYYGLNSINAVYSSYRYNFSTSSFSVNSNIFPCSGLFPYSSLHTPVFKVISSSIRPVNSVILPSYSNIDLDFSIQQQSISLNDNVPTFLSITNGQPQSDFTTVDMSQYDYIILSLKNYDVSTFNTTIYSLGRLCLTPVYNYGMSQKSTYYQGYQIQSCTEYYNTSTPVNVYILQADIDNNAVYYIKRYDNETNILKIPTSIFDITYITSANANDPQVSIGGRSYPVLPYTELTDTANKSTETGYISGQVCALGDVNCEYQTAIGLDISDLFTQPIKVLQNVWASITSVFTLITSFILLIPSPLKEFLISAFMLSIILGILKILIG